MAMERKFLREVKSINAKLPTQGSGRLALAEAIASPENPLTARVIVNRLWQYHSAAGFDEFRKTPIGACLSADRDVDGDVELPQLGESHRLDLLLDGRVGEADHGVVGVEHAQLLAALLELLHVDEDGVT